MTSVTLTSSSSKEISVLEGFDEFLITLVAGSVLDCTKFGMVEIEFTGVIGSVSIFRGLSDAIFPFTQIINAGDGSFVTNIVSDGVYIFPGKGKIRYVGTVTTAYARRSS